MRRFLICIAAGPPDECMYELRDTEEGRDECIRQVSLVHPEWRITWGELPAEASMIFTVTMRDALPGRDPGRGA